MLEQIEVSNLVDNEVVRQSILLIRGRILNQSRDSDNSGNSDNSKIYLYNGNSYLSEENCENSEFKFILELPEYVDLKEGDSIRIKLVLKYQTKEKELRLKLEKPQSAYRLQPIYILCSNEKESERTRTHCELIDVNLRLVQAIYADRINEVLGCTSRTFVLNGPCRIFRTDITVEKVWKSDEQELWSYFAEDLLRKHYFVDGAKNVRLKIVAFIGCTKYDGSSAVGIGDLSYGNIRKHLKGHAALGGGDLALFGTGFFYAWPTCVEQIVGCLRNTRKIDPLIEPDESNYRRNYLGVYATTLGAVCHELGHIFDCGHTENGIMGTGFDFVNRLLIISNRTENLPKRIIGDIPAKKVETATQNRFTKIKRNTNAFLDNYREQKNSDCFYFTRNCGIILANNKWFRNIPTLSKAESNANINFVVSKGIIECVVQPLKIIEIRDISNSLVKKYFEFLETRTFTFPLNRQDCEKYKNTHYVYVLTEAGEGKRFDLNMSDNENS